MRLPRSKVYRAFPELDRFTNAECDEFVRAVRERHCSLQTLSAFSVICAALGTVVGAAVLVNILLPLLPTPLAAFLEKDVVRTAFIPVWTAAGLIMGFMVRDAWLRWAIRSGLRDVRCGGCTYSLLGLPVREGIVVCPECGQRLDLASVGLTNADLIAMPEAAHPTSANPSDSP